MRYPGWRVLGNSTAVLVGLAIGTPALADWPEKEDGPADVSHVQCPPGFDEQYNWDWTGNLDLSGCLCECPCDDFFHCQDRINDGTCCDAGDTTAVGDHLCCDQASCNTNWGQLECPPDVNMIDPGTPADPSDDYCAVPYEWCYEITLTTTPNRKDWPPAEDPPPFDFPGIPDPEQPPWSFPVDPPPVIDFPPYNVPLGGCGDGDGWSFEDGTYEGWIGYPDERQSGDPKNPHPYMYPHPAVFNFGPLGSDPKLSPKDYPAAGPVFGNDIEVEYIDPPGFPQKQYLSPGKNVGGDYWRFSRSIGQVGNWWVGSADWRPRPELQPFAPDNFQSTMENGTGILMSPACKTNITANYMSYYLGGASTDRQYVALLVRKDSGCGCDYRGLGKQEWPLYYGQTPSRISDDYLLKLAALDQGGEWCVQYKSVVLPDWKTERAEPEYLARRVVWDISKLHSCQMRLAVVDDAVDDNHCGPGSPCHCNSLGCDEYNLHARSEHINVDDFRYLADLPQDTEWIDKEKTLGSVNRKQPLWGFADAHTHPMANSAFGGHFIWGDPDDPLQQLYDCLSTPGTLDGNGCPDHMCPAAGKRQAITQPSNNQKCEIENDIVALATIEASAFCWAFWPIPGAVETCMVEIAVIAGQLYNMELIETNTAHGAPTPTSGDVQIKVGFTSLILELVAGGIEVEEKMAGVIPEADANSLDKHISHHYTKGLSKTHNAYHKEMIERAYLGGMRLMIWDINQSETMEVVLEGRKPMGSNDNPPANNFAHILRGVQTAKRLLSPGPGNDPDYPHWYGNWPKSNLSEIAAVAFSPEHARKIIVEDGKMAIILGSEVDRLDTIPTQGGKTIDDFMGGHPWPEMKGVALPEGQIEKLYALGIRKVTLIHGVNNSFGGTALSEDVYDVAQGIEGSGDAGGYFPAQTSTWMDMSYYFPPIIPAPFGLMVIIPNWDIIDHHHVLTSDPDRWLRIYTGGDLNTKRVGGYDDITWRFGFSKVANGNVLYHRGGFYYPQDSFPWMLGSLSPMDDLVEGCNLTGAVFPIIPEDDDPDDVCSHCVHNFGGHNNNAIYAERKARQDIGHFNAKGLTANGNVAQLAAMELGMIFGVEHFSQQARADAYENAEFFATTAYNNPDSREYPVFGEHTSLRGYNMLGPIVGDHPDDAVQTDPNNPKIALNYGYSHEAQRTWTEYQHVGANMGILTAYSRSGGVTPPELWPDDGKGVPHFNHSVANNCDYSSKAFAIRYLKILEATKGRGIPISTDFNPNSGPAASRYGSANNVGRACSSMSSPQQMYRPGEDEKLAASVKHIPLANRDFQISAKSGWYSSTLGKYLKDVDSCTDLNMDFREPLRCEEYIESCGPTAGDQHTNNWGCCYLNELRAPNNKDPGCPSSQMVQAQRSEYSGIWYENYQALGPGHHGSDPDYKYVMARWDIREDRAARADWEEFVYYNTHGRAPDRRAMSDQMYPMQQFEGIPSAFSDWDFNLDGNQHEGLLPDLLQDTRNVGVSFEQMEPVMNGADGIVTSWQWAKDTACAMWEDQYNKKCPYGDWYDAYYTAP